MKPGSKLIATTELHGAAGTARITIGRAEVTYTGAISVYLDAIPSGSKLVLTPEATPFDAARARAIWAQRSQYEHNLDASDMTPGERAYVRTVWDAMGGTATWMDAFFSILKSA